jgi:hypothetical protein
MVEKQPEPAKEIRAQPLEQQYEELCKLRAEIERLKAIVETDRRISNLTT